MVLIKPCLSSVSSKHFFWLDHWIGEGLLACSFPQLFAISDSLQVLVMDVWIDGRWAPRFHRSLSHDDRDEWYALVAILQSAHLSPAQDFFLWPLEISGKFSTGSLYKAVFRYSGSLEPMDIWKARIPAKIKNFLRQLVRGRLPSGDQVLMRHGPGDGKCALCREDVNVDHIFFRCILAQFIWSWVRDAIGCMWTPSNFAAFHNLMLAGCSCLGALEH